MEMDVEEMLTRRGFVALAAAAAALPLAALLQQMDLAALMPGPPSMPTARHLQVSLLEWHQGPTSPAPTT